MEPPLAQQESHVGRRSSWQSQPVCKSPVFTGTIMALVQVQCNVFVACQKNGRQSGQPLSSGTAPSFARVSQVYQFQVQCQQACALCSSLKTVTSLLCISQQGNRCLGPEHGPVRMQPVDLLKMAGLLNLRESITILLQKATAKFFRLTTAFLDLHGQYSFTQCTLQTAQQMMTMHARPIRTTPVSSWLNDAG